MASPFKGILDHFMPLHGGPVTIYRNFGSPQQTERLIPKALKNTKTKHGGGQVFQFRDREDIIEGDIIQQKGSNDLWLVRDTNDFMDGEDFIYFEAEVEKASRTGSPRPKANMGNTVSIGGSVYGALQVGAAHSSQSVNVSVDQQFTSSMNQLRDVVRDSELDELDKEELLHEIGRVEELAKRDDEKAKSKVMERLTVVEKGVSVSEKLAKVAIPLIATVRGYFGLG